MTEPAAVLAIDGGNSKTDVALVARDGSVLSSVRGGGSNHQGIGRDRMVTVLTGLVRAAAAKAGVPPDGPVAAHTSACLAGADLPDEEVELGELIASQGWSVTASVVNDTFAVLWPAWKTRGRTGVSAWSAGPGSTASAWRPTARRLGFSRSAS